MSQPKFLIVDLFCGAGGTTTGFHMAEHAGSRLAKVIACVNHDAKAIESHWQNHPDVKHFEEDIRTLDLTELIGLTRRQRLLHPSATLVLWASLECTNFSKAKGGQPRDADSRTLADHLDRYVQAIDPDYIQIENVVEFMSWGPLDVNGKPVSRKSGSDWMRWRKHLCRFGYRDEWKELNSADFGAYTSRNRLFGCFAKPGLQIVWPAATHGKKPATGNMFTANVEKWKPVKDVLDFTDEGVSIFNRKKPLVDASLERIEAGLIKFVAGGKEAFILKYNSSDGKGRHTPPSVDEPCPSVACQNRLGIVHTSFLAKYYSGKPAGKVIPVTGPAGTIKTSDGQSLITCKPFMIQRNSGNPHGRIVSVDNPARTLTATAGNQELVQAQPFIVASNGGLPTAKISSIDSPSRVITASDNKSLVQPFILNTNFNNVGRSVEEPAFTLVATRRHPYVVNPCFIAKYYGNGDNVSSIEEPAGTITTKDRLTKVQPVWFDKTFTGNGNISSIEVPAGTVMPCDKHRLINCTPFILNPAFGGQYHTVENPCPVIVAIQGKTPLYLVKYEVDPNVSIPVYEDDTPVMVRIKKFMALYGLSDIKMRMLKVSELLPIQGFPVDYQLAGNQTDQKKFIGNSVVPLVVKAWCEAMGIRLNEERSAA